MTNPPPQSEIQNPQSKIHQPSVWQLAFSLLSALTLWGFALMLGFMGLSSIITAPTDAAGATVALPLVMTGAGMAFGGVLLLPSAGLALSRILNQPLPFQFRVRRPGWVILGLPFILGLGYTLAQIPVIAVLTLPVLHILAIGISVLWLLSLALKGLSVGSSQRGWGIFGVGLVLAPFFSIVAELILVLLVAILGMGYLSQDPLFAADLMNFSEEIINNPDLPPDQIIAFFEPLLNRPITMYAGLIMGAVLVPLVEELFKPIGVWLLVGRKPTPVQGFAAGVLSGAGFALFENFTLSASSGEEWSFVILARLGTTMIHILTTGLTGWALALAWTENRYIRLAVTFLTAVVIHGLLNGLVILSIIPEFLPADTNYPQSLINIGTAAPLGFIILVIGGFILLLGCNRNLR